MSDFLFAYDAQNRLTGISRPEGNAVSYILDALGNATQTRTMSKDGLSPVTASAVCPTTCVSAVTCNRPEFRTDGRSKKTEYTWNATYGGLESVALPAPTAGAVRPENRYSYADFDARYKNSSGVIVQDPTTVTLPQWGGVLRLVSIFHRQ